MSVAQATVTQKVNHPPRKPKYGWLGFNLLNILTSNDEKEKYRRPDQGGNEPYINLKASPAKHRGVLMSQDHFLIHSSGDGLERLHNISIPQNDPPSFSGFPASWQESG